MKARAGREIRVFCRARACSRRAVIDRQIDIRAGFSSYRERHGASRRCFPTTGG
jgi:hypothetical protein